MRRAPDLLVNGPLRGDTRARVRVGQAIAGDGTVDATGAIHAATITKGGQ